MYAFFFHKLKWRRGKKYLRFICIWDVFGYSSEFKVGSMVYMTFCISTQLCMFERVVLVQTRERALRPTGLRSVFEWEKVVGSLKLPVIRFAP